MEKKKLRRPPVVVNHHYKEICPHTLSHLYEDANLLIYNIYCSDPDSDLQFELLFSFYPKK